jgi:hypothetical protein
MRYNSPNTVSFIIGVLLTTATFSTLAIFLSSSEMKLWSPEAAGWAQAVGTVFAIFGSFAIANYQSNQARILDEKDAKRKARSICYFFVPSLKTIEADVTSLIEFCEQHKNVGIRDLSQLQNLAHPIRFRDISHIEIILNNAHTFPDRLSVSIPQLLGFRAIIDENLAHLTRLSEKTKMIDGYRLRLLLNWLVPMKNLIAEIYEDMPEVHD